MISFKEINEDNYDEILKLEVLEVDKHFIAPNVRSLADCWLYRKNNDCFPYGIYYGNLLVGFILICIDDKEYYIWRMMIDKNYQNRGYGSKVLEYIIDIVEKDSTIDYILTDYVLGNVKMKNLLEKYNFKEYKYYEKWDQMAMKYYKKR